MKSLNDLWPDRPLTPQTFKNPPSEMSILPFWFWNGEMDETEMEWQLKECKAKGIPGLFIHGRFGLKAPYLSEEWFDRVKFAVRKGKEIGLDIWIYDEMNWPSGTAGRQVIQKYPYLGQKYLEMIILWIEGPLFTFLEATDSRYINTGDSKPIAAYACRREEFENGIENLIDLTPNLSFDKVIPWEAPEGKWVVMCFLEKEIDYYIDALNPEATQRFIEITHDQYKSVIGDEFGKVVPGFYTDEPAMLYFQVGMDNYIIPWSSQMFKIFRQRCGYSLRPYLPALYQNMGQITAKIRYDFWKTLSDQYDDCYYKQLRKWCEENDLIFTGHLMFEHWLRGHARCSGNIFKHLKNLHITGVDHLYPKIGSEDNPHEHVELKLASSAAHHFGSPRLLCESMGGTYWDCTLERMKWIANWEYVLGVNIFNNHGYHYSIEGERKRDWPPSQFYHHTWWKYYDQFTTYISRLGHALSAGHHIADVLVLYPLTSMWANYIPQHHTKITAAIEKDFNDFADALLRLHFDFDYVDEDVLSEASIEDRKIRVGEEIYSVLILPPTTQMKESTYKFLEKYISKGGKLITNQLLPIELYESGNNSGRRELTDCFGIDPRHLLAEFNQGDVRPEILNPKENIFVLKGSELTAREKRKRLGEILHKCITPDVIINHEAVFYLHREQGQMHVYFIINSLQKDIGNVTVSFQNLGQPEVWDPLTGDVRPHLVFKLKNKRISFELPFAASQSYLLIFWKPLPKSYITESNLTIEQCNSGKISGYDASDAEHIYVKMQQGKNSKIISAEKKPNLPPLELNGPFQFDIEDDNVLCLSNWKMCVDAGNGDLKGYYMKEFDDTEWLSVVNGGWEMQLPQERDEEIYPQTLWYRTGFNVQDIPEHAVLLIDGFSGSSYRLFVNEEEVFDKGTRSKIDAEIKSVDIQKYLVTGRNLIAVQLVVNRRTDGILDLLKIAGDFALRYDSGTYVIIDKPEQVQARDWTQQGYPYFSGTGVYRFDFDLPEKYRKGKLLLEVDCGEDVLEVKLNNHRSITKPWHPYRLDITDYVKTGMNRIELKVTNTLINMLEAEEKASGLFATPVIKHYVLYEFGGE